MRKSFLSTLIIVSMLLITSLCYGLKTQEFIDYLANKIYQDCQGEDITIKEGFIIDNMNNTSITVLKYPYDIGAIRRIIDFFSKRSYATLYRNARGDVSASIGVGKPADKILTCGAHTLDISGDDFYWDGMKTELPKQQIDIEQQVSGGSKASIFGDVIDVSGNVSYSKTTGNNSPAVSGKDNIVRQSNFFAKILTDIRVTIPLSIAFVFSLAYNIIFNKSKKKK